MKRTLKHPVRQTMRHVPVTEAEVYLKTITSPNRTANISLF